MREVKYELPESVLYIADWRVLLCEVYLSTFSLKFVEDRYKLLESAKLIDVVR